MRRLNNTPSPHASGFTLLEVLMTLMIMSIGLLGLAAMQVVGMQSSGTANYRSIATLVAGEMAERMRANPTALRNQTFVNVNNLSPAAACANPPTPWCGSWMDGDTPRPAADCNPDQLAAYDINVMFCGELKSSATPIDRRPTGLKMLPGGSMSIACATNPCPLGSQYVITVGWDELQENSPRRDATIRRSLVVNFTPQN